MTSPTNRSIPVQRPPPATWKKSSAQSELAATEAIRATRTAPTMGRPWTGTIWKDGRVGAFGARPSASDDDMDDMANPQSV